MIHVYATPHLLETTPTEPTAFMFPRPAGLPTDYVFACPCGWLSEFIPSRQVEQMECPLCLERDALKLRRARYQREALERR